MRGICWVFRIGPDAIYWRIMRRRLLKRRSAHLVRLRRKAFATVRETKPMYGVLYRVGNIVKKERLGVPICQNCATQRRSYSNRLFRLHHGWLLGEFCRPPGDIAEIRRLALNRHPDVGLIWKHPLSFNILSSRCYWWGNYTAVRSECRKVGYGVDLWKIVGSGGNSEMGMY